MVHNIIIVEKNVFYMCIYRILSKSVDYCLFLYKKVLQMNFLKFDVLTIEYGLGLDK